MVYMLSELNVCDTVSHFMPLFFFISPENIKNFCFFMFSGVIDRDQ